MTLTVGLRNNNPGNLKAGGTPYKGEITPTPQESLPFRKFQSMAYGYRAMFHLLLIRYIMDYGIDTVDSIISRYAPPSENDTNSYINFIADYVPIDRNETINQQDSGTILQIGRGISLMENGVDANETDLQNGWNMLISDFNNLSFDELVSEGKNPNDLRNALLIGGGILLMTAGYFIAKKK